MAEPKTKTVGAEAHRAALRKRIIQGRGYVAPFHDAMLEFDPGWIERYLDFVDAPIQSGGIAPKLVHLIYLAIDAAPSHLYPRGIGIHIARAREYGATEDDLVETIELAASLGLITTSVGMPILAEELAAAGVAPPNVPSQGDDALHKDFEAWFGKAPDWTSTAARYAPVSSAALLELVRHPWAGKMQPKERALIALACHVSPAVADKSGIRHHIREAMAAGATAEELAEVIVLASGIAVHAVSVGAPILKHGPAE